MQDRERMIKLKDDGDDDDEAFEASTKSSSSGSGSNKCRKGDATTDATPKQQQGGRWCWMLPEDGIESQYRHLDFIHDSSEEDNNYSNWENSPSFLVPSNEEIEANEDHHETLSHVDTEDFNQIPDDNNTIDTAITIGNRTIKDDQSPAATAASKDKSSFTATSNERERTSIPGKSSLATIDTTTIGKRKRDLEFKPDSRPSTIGQSAPTRSRQLCRRDNFEGGKSKDCGSAEMNEDDELFDNNTEDYRIPGDNNADGDDGYNRGGSRSILVLSKHDKQWMKMYQRLEAYKTKDKNTCGVPQLFKADPQLGIWVKTQRKHCKDNKKIDLLNDIGFVWKFFTHWGDMYQRLLTYKKEHGTTCVPQYYKADPQLGRWVSRQRHSCTEKDRIDLLNDIGFEWQLKETNGWGVMYQRLVAYKKKHGTTRVPTRSYEVDPKLGRWVNTQRQDCKEKDRLDLLNDIGFEWQLVERNDWGVMYHRLLTYKKKHGTTCVPQRYKADPQLGNWVNKQRTCCKENDRIDLLNDIGFEWQLVEINDWGVMYHRLLTYKKKHGTTRVPFRYKADPQLGNWVKQQRACCKEKDRLDLLNDIGFEWQLVERNDWGVMYHRLLMYKKKHGTTCVPQRYKADPQLGNWVNKQRTCCKDNNRIDLLNNIGFIWNATAATTFYINEGIADGDGD